MEALSNFDLNSLSSQFVGDSWAWMLQAFSVIFFALIIDFFQKRAIKRALVAASKTKNPWDESLLFAVQKPLSFIIWVVGVTFAIGIINSKVNTPIFESIEMIRRVAIIGAVAYFLSNFISLAEKNIAISRAERNVSFDRTTMDAVAKLLRISVYITTSLVALQTMGFSVSGALAFGGIGGMAVALAAKDMLSNLFGGLTIYLDRPFSVGDWIRSPDRKIEGVVETIGWRFTTIRTFDKRPLYLPNSTFSTIAVENPSRMTNRRIYETIGLRYDDISQLSVILEDVKTMLMNHKDIDTSQTLMVNFNEFGESSLDFFIYTFTRTTHWETYHDIKQDVLFKIMEIVTSHNAECAFPTSTIHLKKEMPEALMQR